MIEELETSRIEIQAQLDGLKTQEERNRLGQYATPSLLARDILFHAKEFLPANARVRFLDPALGSGAFFAALKRVFKAEEIESSSAFEIDPHYGGPAEELWVKQGLQITHGDFTQAKSDPSFNLIICNPPYVRHHHLNGDEKKRLQQTSLTASGHKPTGLAGLYVHFLLQCHAWMAPGAVAGWLIPSEFMDVNYGKDVKKYLLDKVTLLQIHRFCPEDIQFTDALVSSAVVWIKNESPKPEHEVLFTFGGSLAKPDIARSVTSKDLAKEPKWTRFPKAEVREQEVEGVVRLSDLFSIKRGIATGDNKFFVLNEQQVVSRNIPTTVLRPILPSPRYVKEDEIKADEAGLPTNVERLFLLDPKMCEEEIQSKYPDLYRYLQEGKEKRVDQGYLCKGRKRWYDQEQRGPAPIVCTYMGRSNGKSGRPFRFLLNRSKATMANTYLAMYPTPAMQLRLDADPGLLEKIWKQLNQIKPEVLLGEGRVYGGGLHKLEPKELSKVPIELD